MDPALQAFVTGFPVFLLQGGAALGLWIVGMATYAAATPYNEVQLIREGNAAAGLTSGAMALGLAIPIASALATSHSLLDLAIWGLAALALQLLAFRVVDMLLRGLPARIEKGEIAAAAVLSGIKLGAALVTAAALNG